MPTTPARAFRTALSFLRLLGALALLVPSQGHAQGSFVNFESGHVRPLSLSPDGTRLFAVNTPDNRLAIYNVGAGGLTLAAEVEVGLEPVTVVARTNTEVWVVNHLSDSISIVQVDTGDVTLSRVVRTLLVGDEPRDLVFAGPGLGRAFITTAHRGQNRAGDPQLTTPGVGRSDVWVFDTASLGAPLGGTPLTILTFMADTPRALARTSDGSTVYVAAFESGNRSTTVNAGTVSSGGGAPPPPAGATGGAPATGLVVKFNTSTNHFEDETGHDWTGSVAFTLPDKDVFIVNANANPPAPVGGTNFVQGVGTILFNMAVRPDNQALYVTNLDSRNEVRFENVLTGNLTRSRITIINPSTLAKTAVHLNPHIDYGVVPGPPTEVNQSLAFPMDMAFSSDSTTLWVVGFGSGKVGKFNTTLLEAGTVVGNEIQIPVGLGPSGLALDEPRSRLYVMNRIDHTISIVSTTSNTQTAVVSLRYDPSPPAAKVGRRFLYDATITSAHGDAACASCHIFGDFDSLAWDLGDASPGAPIITNPNPFRLTIGGTPQFHPLKGPMTTQSLRGMAGEGPMHWRGDRTGGVDPGGDPLDEDAAFKKFNPAFVGLLGHGSQLSTSDMQAYTDFILTVRYPPNPIRALDNSLTSPQSAGQTFFLNTGVDAAQPCNFCHRFDLSQGFFGTDGFSSFENESQEFKVAHLRNAYQKVGMFGVPANVPGIPATGSLGDQVRGFGFLHDGSIATVFDFLQADVFVFGSNANTSRRNLEQFVLSFDTGLRPIVGQQASATPSTFGDATVINRIDLLLARADAGECDVVARGNSGGIARGWVYAGGNQFRSDRASEPLIGKTALRGLAASAGQEQVYTAVPPGSGTRIGIDRDEDGFGDRDELDAGSDPANPASVPGATTTTTAPPTTTTSTSSSSSTSSSATSTSTPSSSSTTTSTVVASTTSFTSTTHFSTTTTIAPSTTTTSTPTTSIPTTSSTVPATTTSTSVTVTTSTSVTTTHTTSTTSTSIALTTSTSVPTTTTSTVPTTSTTVPATTSTTVTTTTVSTTTSSHTTSTVSTTSTSTSSTTSTTLPVTGIRSSALSIKDNPTPKAKKFAFRSATKLDPTQDRIVPPAAGSPTDPTAQGGTLVVYNSAGSGKKFIVTLPSGLWSTIGGGYRFKSSDPNGPVINVTIKADKLSIRGGRAFWGYTLEDAPQGSVAVRLSLGTGLTWCADAPAKPVGNPPSTTKTDNTSKFLAQRGMPPPVTCPPLP